MHAKMQCLQGEGKQGRKVWERERGEFPPSRHPMKLWHAKKREYYMVYREMRKRWMESLASQKAAAAAVAVPVPGGWVCSGSRQ